MECGVGCAMDPKGCIVCLMKDINIDKEAQCCGCVLHYIKMYLPVGCLPLCTGTTAFRSTIIPPYVSLRLFADDATKGGIQQNLKLGTTLEVTF